MTGATTHMDEFRCVRTAFRWLLASAVVAWSLAAAPAWADVRFTFTQTGAFSAGLNPFGSDPRGPLPAGALSVSGSFTLSTEAFVAGVAISADGRAPPSDLARLGLLDLAVTATYLGRPPGLSSLAFTLADLRPILPSDISIWALQLTSGPLGTPTGLLYYNNGYSDVLIRFDGPSSSGTYNTDFGGPCGWTGNCSFTGILSQAVPEPAALALLAVPAAALVAARVRRRRRHRAPPP